jgi:hypothetical protein
MLIIDILIQAASESAPSRPNIVSKGKIIATKLLFMTQEREVSQDMTSMLDQLDDINLETCRHILTFAAERFFQVSCLSGYLVSDG